jgi:hypothetical protein
MRQAAMGIAMVLLLAGCDRERAAFIDKCQRHIDAKLVSPATAKYGSLRDVALGQHPVVADLDRDGYLDMRAAGAQAWMAYVDSESALGGRIRNYVLCFEGEGEFIAAVTGDLDEIEFGVD